MNAIFSHEETNTKRQREFDYLKGLFMLFIYLIHAFQATMSTEDSITQWIYMLTAMSGAAIFILGELEPLTAGMQRQWEWQRAVFVWWFISI